jgi:dTDP-L-rhamnose 4-epimerase
MYEIARYTSVNNLGTAVLLEALIERPVERLVVASSMSLYGEGMFRDADGELVAGGERHRDRLRAHDWEVRDALGRPMTPVPTPESKAPNLSSVYALSKYDQERLCLITGGAYGIATVALRFFNIYGPRQALSNPYTGALAIFASRLLNGNRPLLFEDGGQRRDFVYVTDIARACRLALEAEGAAGQVLNVGSGRDASVLEIARAMAAALGLEIEPEVTGSHRAGDIRHCFADIGLARTVLGYEPATPLDAGLRTLAAWLEGRAADDRVAEAHAELAARGLTA